MGKFQGNCDCAEVLSKSKVQNIFTFQNILMLYFKNIFFVIRPAGFFAGNPF